MSKTIYRLEDDNGFGMWYGGNGLEPHPCITGTPLESLLMPYDSVVADSGVLCGVGNWESFLHWFGGLLGHLVINGFKIYKIVVESVDIDKGNEVYFSTSKVESKEDITDMLFQ